MIRIIDCGSQLTQNIARRIRENSVYAEILPFHTPLEQIRCPDLEGIVISGGQWSVYDSKAPHCTPEIYSLGVPVLGICYGQQLMAYQHDGRVVPSEKREYGKTLVRLLDSESPLFRDIPQQEISTWMSHGDVVKRLPQGFRVTARSESSHIAAIENREHALYAVQFHPEVDHTPYGRMILRNFLHICNAKESWDPEKRYDSIVAETEEKIRGKKGIGGISGGVDSTSASVLVKKLAGAHYTPLFVDNGLLRLNEAQQVNSLLAPFNLGTHFVDASQRFLALLQGIDDPDKKRKIIGNEFIRVFEATLAQHVPDASYLVQGTLYPDVIESVPLYGASSKIKRHHNVGGLPERMKLTLVEPWRELFKDEVRAIAERKLGLPREIVWRQPFPGPGLAIRIVGMDVMPERLAIVRKADHIFLEELTRDNIPYSQAFAGIFSTRSRGVMGDAGTYEYICGLRIINSDDYMTADVVDIPHETEMRISCRIVNEVKGVNRVFFDKTQKPPATIEWE